MTKKYASPINILYSTLAHLQCLCASGLLKIILHKHFWASTITSELPSCTVKFSPSVSAYCSRPACLTMRLNALSLTRQSRSDLSRLRMRRVSRHVIYVVPLLFASSFLRMRSIAFWKCKHSYFLCHIMSCCIMPQNDKMIWLLQTGGSP